ncbi:MAG: DUF736 family protein [Terriglobia bacterium]|nr:DUF736 family protein [Terriglobia bacterium]
MSIIGHFTASKDGGWEGTIQTLSINTKIRLVPNDNQSVDKAPAFRVFVGKSEIGAAWKVRSQGENARDYLSVKLEDPAFVEGVHAALFEGTESHRATLVWNRGR